MGARHVLRWYIEEQRYGEDLIISGLMHDNTAAINAGFTAFNWGFAHQAADGSFAGTADPFHSTSFFVEGVAHACLLIEQSPYAHSTSPRSTPTPPSCTRPLCG